MHAYRSTQTLTALLLLALAACGGGGGLHPPDPAPPPDDEADGAGPIPQPEPGPEAAAAEIQFPPPVSQTDAEAIAVRGASENLAEADQILVNGIVAQSDDGFATWSVDLPLEVGFNHIQVEAFAHEIGEGEVLATATLERVDLLLENLCDLAPGPEDHLALVLDSRSNHEFSSNRIVEIDTISGARRVISQGGVQGEGFEFDSARGLIFEPIQGGQLYIMCDGGNLTPSIYRVEYASGDRHLHSGPERGDGPLFEGQFTDMTIDENLGTLYVAMNDPDQVYSVNWHDGSRTVISVLENDQGVPPVGDGSDAAPRSLAWDHPRDRLLYTGYQGSPSANVLVEIDLASGNRHVIHAEMPWGPRELCIPRDLGARAFLLSDEFAWEFDFDSGEVQVSIASDAPGPFYPWPTNMIVNGSGDRLMWIDRTGNALVAGDPETGEATEVVGNAVGTGTSLGPILGTVLAEEEALFTTRGSYDLCEVDIASGGRSTIPTLDLPLCSVARGPLSRELYVVSQDWPGHGLYRVNPEDSVVTTISASAGDDGNEPYSLVIDREERFAYVLLSERIERIDIETGDRSIVPVDIEGEEALSNLSYDEDAHRLLFVQESGGGLLFELSLENEELRAVGHFGASWCSGLAVDPDAGRALAITMPALVHSEYQQLVSMDIEAGELIILSSLQVGRGPDLQDITSVNLVRETGTVFVPQHVLGLILAIDTVNGDRVIVAR